MRKLVAIGSVKGSPGVTTLALEVAGNWPTAGQMVRPLVVEVDPAGGDVAARSGLSDTPGLMALAAAVRRSALPEMVEECVQLLPNGIPVVTGPAGAQQAAAAVSLFAGSGGIAALRGSTETTGTVLLDLGRLEEPTVPLVQAVDVLLLVTRGEVDALAHVAARVAELRSYAAGVELAVVGPSPYPASEIGAAFGIGRVHLLPWDPRTAAGRHGQLAPRRWRVEPLVRAASNLAWHFAALAEPTQSMLGKELAHLAGTGAPALPGQNAASTSLLKAGEVR